MLRGTMISRVTLTVRRAPDSSQRDSCMAGETGGTGRDLPFRVPLILFPGWDPEGTNI